MVPGGLPSLPSFAGVTVAGDAADGAGVADSVAIPRGGLGMGGGVAAVAASTWAAAGSSSIRSDADDCRNTLLHPDGVSSAALMAAASNTEPQPVIHTAAKPAKRCTANSGLERQTTAVRRHNYVGRRNGQIYRNHLGTL